MIHAPLTFAYPDAKKGWFRALSIYLCAPFLGKNKWFAKINGFEVTLSLISYYFTITVMWHKTPKNILDSSNLSVTHWWK